MIKAVVFDVGGVLALAKNPAIIKSRGNKTLGVHEYISKKLRISLDQWLDSIEDVYAKSVEGKISEKIAVKTIARNNKVTEEKIRKLFAKAYKKNFKINKKLYRIAYKLKKQGFKIGILSDQWYLSKKALIPEKYIKPFDVVIVSSDAKTRKPHPKIYKLLIKKLKLKPSEILFIDNQSWNITPAKKIGIKTILFKDNKQLIKEFKKLKIL